MPRYTVLQIVQDILNEGDMDTVSTWDETIESEQIGKILQTVFHEVHSTGMIRSHSVLKNPDAATGATYLAIPTDVTQIFWIRDDSQDKNMIYLEPDQFISKLDTAGTGVADPGDGGLTLPFDLTAEPTYWTSFDDSYICFNAANPSITNTDMFMYCQAAPTLTLADATVPDVPTDAHPYLLAETKSRAFIALNQEINPKVEQTARELKARMLRENWTADGRVRTPNYGRKTRTSRRGSQFSNGA